MDLYEWTSEQFSFYNSRINDLMTDYMDARAAGDTEGQDAAISELVNVVDVFRELGVAEIEELQAAEGTALRDLLAQRGIKIRAGMNLDAARDKQVRKYEVNIATLRNMKNAISGGDWSALKPMAGSMMQSAFPGGYPAPDAPFKVVMGFLSNMQMVALGMGVSKFKRRDMFSDVERDVCPICEQELCRCCPNCKQYVCICEDIRAERMRMIADFVDEL
jgi:hypothetical protein